MNSPFPYYVINLITIIMYFSSIYYSSFKITCKYLSGILVFQSLSCVWLWNHELQHDRLPYPSLSPGVSSNSCPLSQWWHPTISASVIPFSSHFQSFQHQGLFQWVSSLHQVAKVLELQLQPQSFQWIFSWFPLGLTGLTSLLSEGLLIVFSNTTVQKHQFCGTHLSL